MNLPITDAVEKAGALRDAGVISDAEAIAVVVEASQGWLDPATAEFALNRWQTARRDHQRATETLRQALDERQAEP